MDTERDSHVQADLVSAYISIQDDKEPKVSHVHKCGELQR